MAITLRNTSTVTSGSRTNTTVNAPAGAVNGSDVIVVVMNVGNAASRTVTPPGGWATIGPVSYSNSDPWTVNLYAFVRVHDGNSSWTFTHSSGTSQAFAEAWQEVDTATPQDCTAQTQTGNNTANATIPSITIATINAMRIAARGSWDGTAVSPPASWNERQDTPVQWVGDLAAAATGATGTTTIGTGNSNQVNPWGTIHLALRPGGGLTQVTATRQTTWATLAPVTSTRQTAWTTRAWLASPSTRATSWTTLVPIAAPSTRQTTWATKAQVTSTRQTTWATIGQATSTRAETWKTLAPVTSTRATQWAALAPVTTTRATQWAVLTIVSASTRATQWAVLTTTTSTRATAWATLAPITSTRAETWRTLAAVTSTRAETWTTLQQVTATRAETWAVEGTTSQVTSSRAETWAVLTTVAASTRAETWATLTTVTSTRATLWATLSQATSTRADTWAVAGQVTSTRATQWAVAALVTSTRATQWTVLVPVTPSTRATTWAVLTPVTSTRQTQWDVLALLSQVTSTRQETWATLATMAPTTRATSWNVLVRTPIPVSFGATVSWVAPASSATVTPTYPADDNLDLIIATLAIKPNTATVATPNGWTAGPVQAVGGGTQGAGTGACQGLIFTRQSDGSLSGGSQAFTITGGSSPVGVMHAWKYDLINYQDQAWEPVTETFYSRTTASQTFGGTGAVDLGFEAGDVVGFLSISADDQSATHTISGLSVPGCTLDTLVQSPNTTIINGQGNDISAAFAYAKVLTGPSNAAPSSTVSGSTSETGGGIFYRIRATGDLIPLTSVTSTRDDTWTVLGSVTSTRATQWEVIGEITSSRQTAWTTLATVTSTRQTAWTTLTPVTSTRQTAWVTRSQATSTRATQWATRTSVTSTRATQWEIIGQVTSTRSTQWDVQANLIQVTSTRATTWQVIGQVSTTRQTTWATLSQVTTTRQTQWAVAGQVTSTRATQWDTLGIVSATRITTWDVLTTVASSTRTDTWDVLAQVTSQRSEKWNVHSLAIPAIHYLHGNGYLFIGPRGQGTLSVHRPVATLTVPTGQGVLLP